MKRPHALEVYVEAKFAGTLTRDGAGLRFTYSQEYNDDPSATALSVSMPTSIRVHSNRAIAPWIAGLLPDNEHVIARWARHFQVAPTPFALLGTQVGVDCAGAVQFLPAGNPGDVDLSAGSVEWLTEEQVAQRLADLRSDTSSWLGADFDGRFSLAGAQAKTALLLREGRWGVPSGATATTHILKPAISGLDDHDLNEHLCLRAARLIGLPTAKSSIESFAGERVVVVQRYDRVELDGAVKRIHQEDICQALSVDPSRKYQSDGGPGPADISMLLRDVMRSDDAARAVRQFADALIFNWAIGGTDAHAKNYSLLLYRDRVTFAPLYDVASALPYSATDHKLKLAMKIGSDYYLNTQRPQLWSHLASRIRLSEATLVERAADLLAEIPTAFASAASEKGVDALGSDLPEKLATAVAARAEECRRSLPT